MRRSLFILLLLFAGTILSAQTWSMSYYWHDINQFSYASNVIPAIGGGYLFNALGVSFNSNPDLPGYRPQIFWKIDENGTVIWRRTFGYLEESYDAVVSNGIDRYYALDNYQGSNNLYTFDEEMNHLDFFDINSIFGYQMSQLNDLIYTSDGLIFAGTAASFYNPYCNIIFKMDFAHNLIWENIQVKDNLLDGFLTIKPCTDNGFIAISARTIAKFNSLGDTLWTCTNNDNSRFYDSVESPEGNIFILGRDSETDTYKIYQADSTNHSISAISQGLPSSYYEENLSIDVTSDGFLVFLVHTPQGTIHKFTQQGEHIWSRDFNGAYGSGSKKMYCSDTGYIIFCIGSATLVKADSDGNVFPNADPSMPNIPVQLSHFPNPVLNTVNIKYNVMTQAGQLKLEIFNLRGQRVFTKELQSKMGEFNWNGLDDHLTKTKSGVYFYRIIADNKILKTNKMVILH